MTFNKLILFFFATIFLIHPSCSENNKGFSRAEKNVIEKISKKTFTVETITPEDNAAILSVTRKYISKAQYEYAEVLLKCVNAEKLENLEDRMNFHYLRGMVNSYNSNPGGALADIHISIEECLSLINKPNIPADVRNVAKLFLADLYSFAASLYRSIGKYDKALTFAKEATDTFKASSDKSLALKTAQSIVFEGEMLSRLGKNSEALTRLALAEEIYRDSKPKEEDLTWKRSYLGFLIAKMDFMVRSGRIDDMKEIFRDAEKRGGELDDNKSLAKLNLLKADEMRLRNTALDESGKNAVFKYSMKAIDYSAKSGDKLLIAVSESNLSAFIESVSEKGEYGNEKSIDHLKNALDNFSILNNTFNAEAEFTHYFSMLINTYEKYIDLLITNGRTTEAVYYVEKIRARNIRNLIVRKKMNPESLLEPSYMEKIKRKQAQRDYLLKRYMLMNASYYFVSKDERDRILAAIIETDNEISELRKNAELLSHGYRLITQNPVETETAIKNIKKDEALFLFHLKGNNTAYRWILTDKGIEFKKIFLTSSIDGLVKEVEQSTRRMAYSEKAMENSHFIYNRLFKDLVESGFSRKHWIIIPHDIMALIPYDALVTGYKKDKSPEYLMDKGIAISITPSLTVWSMQDEEKPGDYKSDFLGFADPYYAGRAAQLYQSIRETKRAAAYFKKSRVFVGNEAKESLFKNMELSDFRYVHVSTHGDILNEQLKEPFILFSLQGDGNEDGYLFAREIYPLKIKSKIVSFSACKTALGDSDRYEGLTGFTQAFFAAGVSEIVLTLWSINADSAESLFVEFYKNLSMGMESHVALLEAKKKVKTLYKSPYHWAGVVHNI